MCLRVQDADKPLDFLRVLAAAFSCSARVEVSFSRRHIHTQVLEGLKQLFKDLEIVEESDDAFNQKVKAGKFRRIRLISRPSDPLKYAASESAAFLNYALVLSSGRFELLHYLREISFSIDYHRYGNLGMREKEERKSLA